MSQSHRCDGNFINLELLKAHEGLPALSVRGQFGLEKEHVRCMTDGRLAMSPHPERLGNKADHPFITTDFSESQIEMITPPLPSLHEAHGFLTTLHQIVLQALPEDELLWLQSMPPVLPDEAEIPVAQFEGSSRFKTEYRERLSSIYGRGRQMISGAHFNFSLSEAFLSDLARVRGEPVDAIRDLCYMKMVRNLMRHRWWLVGALGRSPSSDPSLKLKSFDSEQLFPVCCDFGVSIRSSRIGYRNPHPLETDYCTLETYLEALDTHIREGKLLNRNELYMPVRLKLDAQGERISHLEVRLLDLDPEDAIGMPLASLQLLHLFCLFALLEPEPGPFDSTQQQIADERQNLIAVAGFSRETICCGIHLKGEELQGEALEVARKLRTLLDALPWSAEQRSGVLEGIQRLEQVATGHEAHPSSKLIAAVRQQGFIPYHLERAVRSRQAMNKAHFRFHGFEDMELSTQLLLREATSRGVHFDILDRSENFVRLHKLGKEEYVMQATRTSLDRYSHVLLMANKVTTKHVLARVGLRVPDGIHAGHADEALQHWHSVQGKAVVVKPKSTNFGIGITILKENNRRDAYERAVHAAFQEDREILVETFVPGKEFRFFLIDSQVVAILHRVPANVCGDGQRSIRELVEIKNRDPLRGKGYRTPLEKIGLGDAEAWFLESQGYDFDTVPAKGSTVYLRENSNISTGGDSIDFTERVHVSYHEIASRAANAIGVRITGLDMMIEDYGSPAMDDNYAIIEMNFNPAIHIHCFPYEGKNRHLDKALLNQLGFL